MAQLPCHPSKVTQFEICALFFDTARTISVPLQHKPAVAAPAWYGMAVHMLSGSSQHPAKATHRGLSSRFLGRRRQRPDAPPPMNTRNQKEQTQPRNRPTPRVTAGLALARHTVDEWIARSVLNQNSFTGCTGITTARSSPCFSVQIDKPITNKVNAATPRRPRLPRIHNSSQHRDRLSQHMVVKNQPTANNQQPKPKQGRNQGAHKLAL